jgi:hypothetical protein
VNKKHIRGVVVQRDQFPIRRKADCCRKEIEAGESVLVVPKWKNEAQGYTLLHRRCLAPVIDAMPLDVSDVESRFKSLQKRIRETGSAFPRRK